MKGKSKLIRTLRVSSAVGFVTFKEVLRDKILYNILICSLLLFGVAYLSSQLMVIHPERIILDFGLSAIGISCAAIGILSGSTLIGKEFERRTIYVALAHPISKAEFVVGKYMGLMGIILLNWILFSGAYVLFLHILSVETRDLMSFTFLIALVFKLIQSLLISSVAILFSTFSTSSLSVMFSIGIFLTGSSVSQIYMAASKAHAPVVRVLLQLAARLLPNFEYFNLGTQVTYALPVEPLRVSMSVLYGLFVIALSLSIAGILIKSREI